MKKISTTRLKLRRWKDEDKEPFANLNADPRVMEFMPKTLSREESHHLIERIESNFKEHGFGLFAAELAHSQTFIGFIGLAVPRFQASFTPCVEIGWRLAFEHWGNGYATEGAKAVLEFAFTELNLTEVVSFTALANLRSRRVMERIGMKFIEQFDHPSLPEGHSLRRHVLYTVTKASWNQ
jgi:RimJ/RimL family protein N-acetyltransferase